MARHASIILVLLVMCDVIPSPSSAVSFVSEPSLTRRYVGDDVPMEWTLSSDSQDFSLSSFYNENNVSIIRHIHGGRDRIGPGYEGRVSFYSTSSRGVGFRLTDVTLSDAGRYRCQYQPLTEPTIESSSVLFIFDEPSAPVISLTGELKEGDRVTLLCAASSTSLPAANRPAMTYTWTRNGQPIDSDNPPDRHSVPHATGRRLDISPVSRDDVTYSCTAREEGSNLDSQTTRELNVLRNNAVTIGAGTSIPIVVIVVIIVVIVLRMKRRVSKREVTQLETVVYRQDTSHEATPSMTNKVAEFGESEVSYLGLLSDGAFFQLHSALVHMDQSTQTAVVKTVKDAASNTVYTRYLADHMSVLLSINHANIVTLLGCQKGSTAQYENVATVSSLSLVLDAAPGGDLHAFLTENCSDAYQKTVTKERMRNMALEVATGALVLSELKPDVLHYVMRTKHVLLDSHGVCKLTGFSTAEAVRAREAQEALHKGKRPVRWMSAETLDHLEHTTKSDVWSFGVLLWELLSLGETPYAALDDAGVQVAIQEGQRLDKPNNCDPATYELMLDCWVRQAERRPCFEHIKQQLSKYASVAIPTPSYTDEPIYIEVL